MVVLACLLAWLPSAVADSRTDKCQCACAAARCDRQPKPSASDSQIAWTPVAPSPITIPAAAPAANFQVFHRTLPPGPLSARGQAFSFTRFRTALAWRFGGFLPRPCHVGVRAAFKDLIPLLDFDLIGAQKQQHSRTVSVVAWGSLHVTFSPPVLAASLAGASVSASLVHFLYHPFHST